MEIRKVFFETIIRWRIPWKKKGTLIWENDKFLVGNFRPPIILLQNDQILQNLTRMKKEIHHLNTNCGGRLKVFSFIFVFSFVNFFH